MRRPCPSGGVENFASAGGGRGHPVGLLEGQIRFKRHETYFERSVKT